MVEVDDGSHKSEAVWPHPIDLVADYLCSRVRSKSVIGEIEHAVPVARALFDKLQLGEETREIDSPSSWEKAALMLAVAWRWQGLSSGDYKTRKYLSRVMASIYPQEERERLASEVEIDEVDPGILGLLVARSYPGCWQALGWQDEENPEGKLIELDGEGRDEAEQRILTFARDNLTKDGVLLLPYTTLYGEGGAFGDAQRDLRNARCT